jgi:hypothetical protein
MNKILPIILVVVLSGYSSNSFSKDLFNAKMASAFVARDFVKCGAFFKIMRDDSKHKPKDYQTFNDAALEFFEAGEKYAKMADMSKDTYERIQQLAYSKHLEKIESDDKLLLMTENNEYCSKLYEDPMPVILNYMRHVDETMKKDE